MTTTEDTTPDSPESVGPRRRERKGARPTAQAQGSELHAAIAAVMATIERLPEEGVNRSQGWTYVTDATTFDAVRQKLGEAGVTILQEFDSVMESNTRTTESGGVWRDMIVLWRFVLTHAPSGEREEWLFPGQGADSGDKVISKTSTSAAKFFLRRLFMLSGAGGDDPDADSPGWTGDERPARGGRPISDKQERRLWAIARSESGLSDETVNRIVWTVTRGATFRPDEIVGNELYNSVVEAIKRYPENVDGAEEAMSDFEAERPMPTGEATDEPPPPDDAPPGDDGPPSDEPPY